MSDLAGCPRWMRRLVSVLFGYAMLAMVLGVTVAHRYDASIVWCWIVSAILLASGAFSALILWTASFAGVFSEDELVRRTGESLLAVCGTVGSLWLFHRVQQSIPTL